MPILRLWALIALGAILTIAGDAFLKRSNGLGHPRELALGLCFYMFGALPVVVAFKHTDFGIVFIVWEAVTVVVAIMIGRVVFGEALTTSRLVAVGFAIAALILSAKPA